MKAIHDLPKGSRLAFDENISADIIGKYAKSGCLVVYCSPMGTPDEVWVEEAYMAGAEYCISRDLDIPNIIDRMDYEMKWREP